MNVWAYRIADMNFGTVLGILLGLFAFIGIALFWAHPRWRSPRGSSQGSSQGSLRICFREVHTATIHAPRTHRPLLLDITRCELHGDGTVTTPEYWYCDCFGGTYWPRTVTQCPRCLTPSSECSDADVLGMIRKYGDTL